MIRIGSKYQTFEGDTRKVYRVTRFKNTESIVVYDPDDKKFYTKTKADIDAMVEITPDALLDFMITSYENGDNDVYACVYRLDSIIADVKEPAVILRQDIYSYAKNPLAIDGKIYVGDCLTQYTMPGDEKLISVAEFSKVDHNFTISIYSNDTLDDIFMCIPSKQLKKFNAVLAKLATRNTSQITGYCENLRALIEDNNFIGAYRSIFNITQVDFPIILGSQSYNAEGDIILNDRQIHRIEDLLRKYIRDVKVIEYDHDVDVGSIISYKHILISDSNQKIFLIAYQEVGSYPVDGDIAQAMGVN